jgi:hypothetical protein
MHRLLFVGLLLVSIVSQGILLSPISSASENYRYINIYSKLTFFQDSSSSTFQIRLGNGVPAGPLPPVSLTLRLDEGGEIQSTITHTFIGDNVSTLSFPISKEMSTKVNSVYAYYSPTIVIGEVSLKIPEFKYTLNCYSKLSQSQIIGKDYPFPNIKINLNLKDNCPPKDFSLMKSREFTGDFTVGYPRTVRGSTFDLKRDNIYQDTFLVKGEYLSREGGSISPYLRMLDFFGNTRILTLNTFKVSRNEDWTKNYKTCIFSQYEKTSCGPFNSATLEFCSPLEDFRVSKFDGKKWTRDPEILSGEKNLGKCESTTPYYYYEGTVGNESLKVPVLIRYNFLATPTQKSQVWTFTIKNIKK